MRGVVVGWGSWRRSAARLADVDPPRDRRRRRHRCGPSGCVRQLWVRCRAAGGAAGASPTCRRRMGAGVVACRRGSDRCRGWPRRVHSGLDRASHGVGARTARSPPQSSAPWCGPGADALRAWSGRRPGVCRGSASRSRRLLLPLWFRSRAKHRRDPPRAKLGRTLPGPSSTHLEPRLRRYLQVRGSVRGPLSCAHHDRDRPGDRERSTPDSPRRIGTPPRCVLCAWLGASAPERPRAHGA